MRFFAALLLSIAILLTSRVSTAQPSLNLELLFQIDRGDGRYSGCWYYADSLGREYALLGAKTGLAVILIDHPNVPSEVDFVPGPVTNWREVTVVGDFAYVVTDVSGTDHGMQVIDLRPLPDSVHLVTTYRETFTKGHIIQKNLGVEEPYVYVMGTQETGGVHILDVSNPAEPQEVALYAPGYYIHDSHIRGDLLFACAFNKAQVDILDISERSNPLLVGVITYDGSNTHSASSTEDGRYLIIADEKDGNPAHVFDLADLSNPVEVAHFTSNPQSLVHNPYIRGDFCFVSHNTEGLRVYDIADPGLPVEVGYYDTWSGPSGGFNGLWSACPYLPSGRILGGNRHDGLYIWSFNDTRAARAYGLVVDSLTQTPLDGAEIFVLPIDTLLTTPADGGFRFGALAGAYTLQVQRPGYLPKTLSLDLLPGDSLSLTIELVPEDLTASNERPRPALKIYPIPAESLLFLFGKLPPNAEEAALIDARGQTVRTLPLQPTSVQTLDLSGLPSGLYFLQLLGPQWAVPGLWKFVKR